MQYKQERQRSSSRRTDANILMIQLCVVKIAPRKWAVTTTDMVEKYERAGKLIKKMREQQREWKEDQPHWSVIYDKEPE